MEVVITEWALKSYLEGKKRGIFSSTDYSKILRPDAELLKTDDPFDPLHTKFSNDKFWGPAKDKGAIIKHGYKMKWHNFGAGKNQLRLCVVIVTSTLEEVVAQRAFLCTSYIKNNITEKIEMAALKIKIAKIISGNYKYRGSL